MQERIIKRYPNRRLYDTTTSRYITLDEVKTLVLTQVKFKIVDSRSHDDLTTYVLLQIISEQENKQFPLFTTSVLENIIRFYGNPLQKTFSQLLEKLSSEFLEENMLKDCLEKKPLDVLVELTKHNLDFWQTRFSSYVTQKDEGNVKKDEK